ncbi:MAG TPA: hypothetical protein VLF62_02505, partial [Candidatus Saccharimonadales bacterium]|nr:hypothetical protein [Candidatus Saccharimonadales bacterium]
KEQFEEIMRAEMGEDYTRMASGEHLGETEDEPAPGDPRTFVANWPHQPSEYADPAPPAQNEGEPDAFYYAEAEPQPDPQEPRPFNNGEAAAIARAARFDQLHAEARDANTPYTPATPHRAGGGGGGTTPPTPPTGGTHGAASGGMPFGGGGGGGAPATNANFNVAPSLASAAAPLEMLGTTPNRREKPHHGRYFAAGFITGWAVKQHLANKQLKRVNEAHNKAAEAQQEKVDTLTYNQHHMGQRLKRTEGQLRETEAAVTAQATRAAEDTAIARQHQERMERAIAETPAAVAAPAPQLAERPAPAPVQERAFTEQPVRSASEQPLAAERPRPAANAMESMPLQYAAAAAETPFAAASVASAAGAAERGAPAAFAAEAQKPAPAPERPPQTPEEAAAALVEQAYNLQSGQHVEHAAGGGHNIIVDKHGHEVQDAMVYGDEFKFQQRQEQARAGAFDNDDDDTNANKQQRPAEQQHTYNTGIITGLGGGGGGTSGYPAGPQYGAGDPHTNAKRLPLGIPKSVSPQHLLRAKNQNPLVATVASPWVWASVIVLIVAFFVAAFI